MGVLSGVTGGGWGLLAGWIMPSAIVVTAAALLVFPADLPITEELHDLDVTERALVLGFASVAIGFLLSAAQTPLYRVLEGYLLLPATRRVTYAERQLAKKKALQKELDAAKKKTGTGAGINEGLLVERLKRYPVDDGQIAPTALGNAIRAFETYGFDRYHLDSQTMWAELEAVVPESLRLAVERARVPVDFCVSLLYLMVPVALLAAVAAAFGPSYQAWMVAVSVIALASIPCWYRLAVATVSGWYSAVQALVNVGRVPLAASMKLKIPAKLDKERELWDEVRWFVGEGYDVQTAKALDKFRLL